MATKPATSLTLDPATRSRLQRLANARRRPVQALLRDAIDRYLAGEEGREQMQQDALAAWADYRATGEHVTAAEADAWMAKLEAGEDEEPPQPHK